MSERFSEAPPAPSSARSEALALHQQVRRALAKGLVAVRAARAGDPVAAWSLRVAALEIATTVRRQIRGEDVALAPVLADLDAWGPQRLEKLEALHERERAALNQALEGVGGLSAVATELEGAIREILRALRIEERELLDPDLLDESTIVNPYQGGS